MKTNYTTEMVKSVANYTGQRLYSLAADERSLESGAAKARLAHLRHGAGKAPGELPELWGEFLQNLPEELMGKDKPSCAEWAVYTALTLFALHQQGHSEPMHASGNENRLGIAVSRLIHSHGDEDEVERIRLRLGTAANSDDMTELAYRLKTIVQLLSREGIKLDYIDLARDLFLFQYERSADNIRLKWGQDFYKGLVPDDRKEDNHE